MDLLADNNAALAGLITASIVVPLAILVVVVWFFFRSARRFDREQEQAESEQSSEHLFPSDSAR